MSSRDHPLRRDAAENRDRILTAAADLFAERGLGVTLNDIARRAGVGVGTAYRRFANKDEVIDALFEKRMDEVADLATACRDDPDAWNGLARFLDEALHMRHGDRGLNELMDNPALGDARVQQARDRIAPILADLVSHAQAQGVVRADLDQTDLIFLQLGLAAIMDAGREIAPDLYRRHLTLMLDALRPRRDGVTPLPIPPLSAEDTHRVMTRRRR